MSDGRTPMTTDNTATPPEEPRTTMVVHPTSSEYRLAVTGKSGTVEVIVTADEACTLARGILRTVGNTMLASPAAVDRDLTTLIRSLGVEHIGHHHDEIILTCSGCVREALVDIRALTRASSPVVELIRPDDEHLEVHVDGALVASANHAEYGCACMDAVEALTMRLCAAFGVTVA